MGEGQQQEEDKVARWLRLQEQTRAKRQFSLGSWFAFSAMLALMLGAWLVLERLDHQLREDVFRVLVPVLFTLPVLFVLLPRRWILFVYALCSFGVLAATRYCGDMGQDGHYLTAGSVCCGSVWAGVLAWLLMGRAWRKRE